MQPATQPFFLYARKSTDVEDKQVLSIEGQLAELREYARRENLSIIGEYIEKQSAKIPGRPIFNDMMVKIERGQASGIVSWHPDRLARNSVDGGRLIYLVDTGAIMSLKFPQFWFEATPQGKFMLQIAFGQSKYFVDSLSENTKRGLRQKVRRGEMPGFAPPGYLNDSRTKIIVIDKRRAPVIKQLFELFSTGKYTLKNMTYFLAQHGITTSGGKLLKDKISWILSNPFYYGDFRYAGEIHEGIHEPLITKKLFDAVQGVLHRRTKPWSKERVPKPFTGLLKCGSCGMMITAEVQKGHTYYRCTRKSKTIECNDPFTREEALDQQLSDLLLTVSLRPDWAKQMARDIERDAHTSAQSVAAIVAEKQIEISKIEIKLRRLLDSYLDQDIDKETYRKKKQELVIKKKTLEESIFTLQQSQNSWLEPMKTWIADTSIAASVARGTDLTRKREYLKKAFGLRVTLSPGYLSHSM